MSEKYGILHGKINEPYANMGVCITRDPCNLVGISYPGLIVLYRVFDGSYIHYFSKGVTIDILASHYLISDLMLSEFDEEMWRVDGHEGSLIKRLKAANGRAVSTHVANRDYKKILLNYAGLTNDIVANGYYRVNEIILATCGGSGLPKDILTTSIVSSKYIKPGVLISKEYRNAYPEPTSESIKSETLSYMKCLMNAFIELSIENKLYQTFIMNLGNLGKSSKLVIPDVNLYIELLKNGLVTEEDKIKLATILSPIINGIENTKELNKQEIDDRDTQKVINDISEEFDIIRSGISTLMSGFREDKIPVLYISDLVFSFNNLADKMNIPRLDTCNKNDVYSSISALVVAGNNGFEPNEINVKLSCGNIVILPTKSADLSEFSYTELIEILRYLMSIGSFDSRFNSLTTQITQELAIKTKMKSTY